MLESEPMSESKNHPSNSKLDEARRHYVQSLAETMSMYGLSSSMGLLYGIMFFRDVPMTLDEMCAESGMSKTSMSVGVRELNRLKLVHKKLQKGVRKDLYEVERNHFRAFVEFFTLLWSKEVELNEQGIVDSEKALQTLIDSDELSEEEVQQVKQDLEKLERVKPYYDWLRDMVKQLRKGGSIKPPQLDW